MSELPIRWPDDGLIPAVIQDDATDAVLMVGFMNAEALTATRSTGEVHFWSRSRNELWHKGASSGHIQRVRNIAVNCELNSLLIRVEQIGAVCHDGYATCYYRELLPDGTLERTQDRLFDPRDVYGDGFGLVGLTQRWWGAYEYLRDHDLAAVSTTSRLLRSSDASVLPRIQDELQELAGVLDGTHMHQDQREDALLEASQCAYWIVIECLLQGIGYEAVRPDRALDVPEATVGAITASLVLRAEALSLEQITAGTAMHLLRMIAEAVRTLDIDPRAVIERDLAELQGKPYLAEFFAR
ncbi:MAG: phosphoribosyl-AMP cyclohydrolase [Thermomicrobiales bacterium]|nr:phosphoribosyl-AMP cyclohydrolase [Thermomicrobiales bacterium]